MSSKEIVAVDPIKGVLRTNKYEPFVGEVDNSGATLRHIGGVSIFYAPLLSVLAGISFHLLPMALISGYSFLPIAVFGWIVGKSGDDLGYKRLRKSYRKWLQAQGFSSADYPFDSYGDWAKKDSNTLILEKLDGKKYALKMTTVDGKKISSYEPVKKPKPKQVPVEKKWNFFQSFTATGQEITDSIKEQAKHLLSFPLSVEDQHAVERILSDMNELNKLGGMTEGSEPNKLYMRTLKTLHKEIKAVATQVNTNMVKQLKIHASYVEERNRNEHELGLPQNRKATS